MGTTRILTTKRQNVSVHIPPFNIGTEEDVLAKNAEACLCSAIEVEPGTNIISAPIIDKETGEIIHVNKTCFEAEMSLVKLLDDGKEYQIGIGDTTKDNKHLIFCSLDPLHWVDFKLYVPGQSIPSSEVSLDGKKVTWPLIGAGTRIETELRHNEVKTTLICNPQAQIENLYFTVKIPVGCKMELLDSGEIAFNYLDGECGYMPKPAAWAEDFTDIPIEFLILPDINIDGIFYPLVKVVVTPTSEQRLGDIYIDPSFSYNYAGISGLSCHLTTPSNWLTFDQDGVGLSWGEGGAEPLGACPDALAVVCRVDGGNNIIELYNAADGTVWCSQFVAALNNLLGSSNGVNFVAPSMYDGYLTYARGTASTSVTLISFKENLNSASAGGRMLTVANKTYGTAGTPGKISDRNDLIGYAYSSTNLDYAGNVVGAKLAFRDSADVIRVLYWTYTSGVSAYPAVFQPLTPVFGGRSNATLTYPNSPGYVSVFKESSGNTHCICAASGGSSALIQFFKQATYQVTGGTFASDFRINDSGGIFSGMTTKNYASDRILMLWKPSGGANTIYIMRGDAINSYSGDKTFANFITDGNAIRVVCSSAATGEFKIVDDIFISATWNTIAEVEGGAYKVVTTSVGIFAIDCTDEDVPVYAGHLTNSVATGIFAGLTLLDEASVLFAGGAQIDTNIRIVLSTTNYLYFENISLIVEDLSAPTGIAITYPNNYDANIPTNVTIQCSAGSDDTPPISYYFQLATDSGFTQNVRTSGWITTTYWQPYNLSLATTYYVRVKGRDSAPALNESAYSSTVIFLTKGSEAARSRFMLYPNTNPVNNPSFVNTTTFWYLQEENGADGTSVASTGYPCMLLTVNSNGTNQRDLNFRNIPKAAPDPEVLYISSVAPNFLSGQTYFLSFGARSTVAQNILITTTDPTCSYTNRGLFEICSLSTNWTNYGYVFVANTTSNINSVCVRFNIGTCANSSTIELDPIYLNVVAELFPDPGGYIFNIEQDRVVHRTYTQAYRYCFETYNEWEIKESWVTSCNASIVNSWWKNNQTVRFVDDTTNPLSYYSVKVMNESCPTEQYTENEYLRYFKRYLILEST